MRFRSYSGRGRAAIRLAALVFVFAAAGGRAAEAQFNFSDEMRQYLRYLPPEIERVRFKPENPAPGEAVEVTAVVRRLNLKDFGADTEDYVSDVGLTYSVDGGEPETIDMDQDGKNEKLWRAEIPEQAAGAVVRFHISATDTADNIAFELPPNRGLPGYEPGSDPPGDPFEHLSNLLQPKKEISPQTPGNLKINNIDFGYDAERYYFRIRYDGRIEPGTIQPLDGRAYLIAIISGPLIASQAIVDYTSVWFYAPLLEMVPALPGIGKIPGFGFVHVKKDNIRQPIFATTGFTHTINDNVLTLAAERAPLGETENIAIITGNVFVVGDFSKPQASPGDISPAAVIYFRDHAYTVSGEAGVEDNTESE